jgi:TatD DNase family protein
MPICSHGIANFETMLIDSHCHLASHKFEASELDDLIACAMQADVRAMVSLATCLEDIDANLTIADTYQNVGVCLGIHPCDVHNAPDDAVDVISQLTSDRRVVGIGETGLDYYHPAPDGWEEEAFRQRQRDFLEQHFLLAKRCGLGLVIHTRDRSGCQSFDDALEIYQRHASEVRALFHCFIGTHENALRVLALGGLVSFGGVTTFKTARDVLEVAMRLTRGSFLLETDSPYLAPVPFRGKRNEPAYVRHTAECIAAARGEALDDLTAHCGQATLEFFPRLREKMEA